MHQDIERAIEKIDDKIIELQRAKRTLIEAFGKETGQQPSLIGTTKKQVVIKLVQEQGALRRSEILTKTGFAQGTVSNVLNDKKTFKHKNGKWYLIRRREEEQSKEKSTDANPTAG